MKRYFWLLPVMVLGACVSVDQLPPGSIPAGANVALSSSYPDLDPGATTLTSFHFTVKAYLESDARALSQTAESLYTKIGNDTGLYKDISNVSYLIVVYKDRDEFMQKTHQPVGSRAVITSSGVYTYNGTDLEPELAHDVTHLIFNGYMGDRASSFKWMCEGLAMFEEVARMAPNDRANFQSSQATHMRQTKMPFSQMEFFVTQTEEKRAEDAWYQQVESVMGYLLSQGSPLGFESMLSELKYGADLDKAIGDAYPAKYRNMVDLENAWKVTI